MPTMILAAGAIAAGLVQAAVSAAAVSAFPSPYAPYQFPNAGGLAAFQEAKFGLFVHWGPVSQWGAEISFPLVCTGLPCTTQGPNGTDVTLTNESELVAHRQAYAQLATTFNPTAFDAEALAALAQAAGFKYLTWVATHCDGFSNWDSTSNRAYSIMASPYGKDVMGAMVAAFRRRGLRAGFYVCPSLWNRDDYWAPSAAATTSGTCCQPNYPPLRDGNTSAQWGAFVSYLHGELADLAAKYAPQHAWLDSGSYPPAVDTHLEQLAPVLRAANAEAVMQVRDGGVWHDFIDSTDHSETDAHALLGMSYFKVGDPWEVPGTLGEQWAFDPRAVYKDAQTVARDLVGVVAKGGNFLLNIGLDPTGVWAPDALTTLANLSSWMAFNSEALFNTSTVFPYEYYHGPLEGDDGLLFTYFFTQSLLRNSIYVFLVADRGVSTEAAAAGVRDPSSSDIILPHFKPSTLAAPPLALSLLTAAGDAPIAFTYDEAGVSFPAAAVLQPVPVALATYWRNYSAELPRGNRPLHSSASWPRPWWVAATAEAATRGRRPARGRLAASAAPGGGGATGSQSLRRLAERVRRATAEVRAAAPPTTLEDNVPCGTRACSVYTQDQYALVRTEGVCYKTAVLPGGAAAVPVNLWWNGDLDNLGAPASPADGQSWDGVDVECYAFAEAGAGRLPLEVWHSAELGDYWTLAAPDSRAAAVARGYALYTSVGFVEPAPAAGGSGLSAADRVADVASYAYVVRVDF